MPGELLVAELAPGPPLRACVLQVVFHEDARYLGPAVARAGDGIVLARVQVPLEGTSRRLYISTKSKFEFEHVL